MTDTIGEIFLFHLQIVLSSSTHWTPTTLDVKALGHTHPRTLPNIQREGVYVRKNEREREGERECVCVRERTSEGECVCKELIWLRDKFLLRYNLSLKSAFARSGLNFDSDLNPPPLLTSSAGRRIRPRKELKMWSSPDQNSLQQTCRSF